MVLNQMKYNIDRKCQITKKEPGVVVKTLRCVEKETLATILTKLFYIFSDDDGKYVKAGIPWVFGHHKLAAVPAAELYTGSDHLFLHESIQNLRFKSAFAG